MLKVTAQDFGPVVKGTVAVKPLTIFLGPSNSGKSYFATLIYSLTQSSRLHGFSPFRRFVFPTRPYRDPFLPFPALPEAATKALRELAKRITDRRDWSGHIALRELPLELRKALTDFIRSTYQPYMSTELSRDLQRYFGDLSTLPRRSNSATSLQIILEQEQPHLKTMFQLSNGSLSSSELEYSEPDTILEVGRHGLYYASREIEYVFAELTEVLVDALFSQVPNESYYLPAARSGIAQGHKAIASILVRQSPLAAIQPLEIPTLSGTITDFISHILTIETRQRTQRAKGIARVADFLEAHVVQGKVDIDATESLTYPEIYYEPLKGQPQLGRFPFHRTSSMVSELAPVVLFLKYLVGSGDFVVLEEPESHLHPAIQRQMARAIAHLVNSGVRVLITTHSDYLVGQINNLIRLSQASKKKLAAEGYVGEDCLKADDVGAYHFSIEGAGDGSVVCELAVSAEQGISEDAFVEVVKSLYEETLALQGAAEK